MDDDVITHVFFIMMIDGVGVRARERERDGMKSEIRVMR